MADPDLQIKGGGRGAGHPDTEIRGEGVTSPTLGTTAVKRLNRYFCFFIAGISFTSLRKMGKDV